MGEPVEIVFTHEFISGDCEEAENEIKSLRTQLAAAQATIAQRDAQVAALEADRDAWRKEREDVANLLYTQEGRLGALTEQLAARDAQVAELTAALSDLRRGCTVGSGRACRLCLGSWVDDETIEDHHPWCPMGPTVELFRALLARTPAAPAAQEEWCTEDRHIVLPSGEACVCGENVTEQLL